MTDWLLDTNVISELRRPNPSRRVSDFIAGLPIDRIFLSVVTFAELRFGIETLDDPVRRSDLTSWLESAVRAKFGPRTLDLTEDILLKWRLIIEAGRHSGVTYSHPDVLIAATAAHLGLVVVTRNTGEFTAAGVPVFNPWTGKSIKPTASEA